MRRLFIFITSLCFSFGAHSFDLGAITKPWPQVKESIKAYKDKRQERAAQDFSSCREHFPQGEPMRLTIPNSRPLCFDEFAILYGEKTKTPLVAVERLSRERLQNARGLKRTNKFYEEARLPSSMRAQLRDYVGSNYDRGHMAPAADMPSDAAMAQSFSLANIIPQNPFNNQKIWSVLEQDVRKFARRTPGDTYVYTGPLFRHQGQVTIGSGRVWVPDLLFKVVYNPGTNKAFVYLVENTAQARVSKPISYEDFVKQTRMDVLGKFSGR